MKCIHCVFRFCELHKFKLTVLDFEQFEQESNMIKSSMDISSVCGSASARVQKKKNITQPIDVVKIFLKISHS